ncbi:MAG: hypothetical protein KGH65_00145 [Candidatus Micrarchaeota archaeon]|nr:hypothetical protein [Candidatus Micrarchaeota archaeon]
MATKKNNKRSESMMHDHMMMHRSRKGKGIVFLIIGLIFLYVSYTWNPAVISAIIALGIGAWFISRACAKLGLGYGWGCNCGGCGCGCEGECNCEMDEKH